MDDSGDARRHLTLSIGRGFINLVDDTGVLQTSQIDLGPIDPKTGSSGLRDTTPVVYHYGFAANPPPGGHAVALFTGGRRSDGVVIATSHLKYRLKGLASGDVALDDFRGAYAWFQASGLVVDAAGGDVIVQGAGNITLTGTGTVTINPGSAGVVINGDVQVNGKITATGDVKAGSISLESHEHGGVTTGSGNTAGPH